jgi:hypothetical protein
MIVRKARLVGTTVLAVTAALATTLTAQSATAATPRSAPAVLLAAESPNAPVSYQGFAYSSSVTAPSADKPQSKLWFKDGSWWGLLVATATNTVDVHELMANHTWRDTGVVVDTRPTSTADATLIGNTLYVGTRTTSGSVRVARFAYTAGSRTWGASGSAATLTGTGARSITLAVDSTGTAWATYAQGTTIFVASAPAGTNTWSTPVALPVPDSTVNSEDISAIIAFSGKIGVFWDDQQSDAIRFGVHTDGASASTWTVETVASGGAVADNHVNVKALVDDPQGRIFAVTKTSYDTVGAPSTSPIITVWKRASNGTWTSATAGTIGDKLTRPQLALDQASNRMYVLMTGPTAGGTIYYKSSSLDTLSFSSGRGDVFMAWSGAVLNNVSTTKDVVSSTTGLVAIASDDTGDRYYHAELALSGTPPPVDTTPPSNPTNVAATAQSSTSVSVAWTASTDDVGVTGYRVYRNGSLLTTTPTVGYTDSTASPSTAYTYGIAAVDAAGNASATVDAAQLTTPPGPVGGAVAYRSGATAQVGSGSSLVVTKPAGLAVGDVMIAAVSSRGNPTISAPAGWTLVNTTTNSTTMRQAVYWHAAGGAEPASYTFTLSQAKAAVVQVNAYSGVSTSAPVRSFAGQSNASSTTLTAPAVTANSADGVVVLFGIARSSNLTLAASLTKRTQIASVGGSNFVSGAEGDRTATVTGSTGTFTATSASGSASVGHTLALAPA